MAVTLWVLAAITLRRHGRRDHRGLARLPARVDRVPGPRRLRALDPRRPDLAVLALDVHLRQGLPRHGRRARPAPAAATTARTSPTRTTRSARARSPSSSRREDWQLYAKGHKNGEAALLREAPRTTRRTAARRARRRRLHLRQPRGPPRRHRLRAARLRAAHRPEPARDQARGVLAAAGATRAGVDRPARRHAHPALDDPGVRPARLGRGRPRPRLVLHVARRRRTSAASRCTCPTRPN